MYAHKFTHMPCYLQSKMLSTFGSCCTHAVLFLPEASIWNANTCEHTISIYHNANYIVRGEAHKNTMESKLINEYTFWIVTLNRFKFQIKIWKKMKVSHFPTVINLTATHTWHGIPSENLSKSSHLFLSQLLHKFTIAIHFI